MSSSAQPSRTTGVRQLLEQEGRERLILIVNHVLVSEPVAQQRLRPHSGRRLRVVPDGWPRLLSMMVPPPAPLEVVVTPAGLLDLCPMLEPGDERQTPDLEVVVDSHDPLGMVASVLAGGMPSLQVAGDAQLAADVNWLADNLRWDVAADIERLFGPVPAERLRTWGLAIARGLREAVSRLTGRGGAL